MNFEQALSVARANQRRAGDYIHSARRYPEWLLDVEGAKRGAEDNLMEEAIILREMERKHAYSRFLESKRLIYRSGGRPVKASVINPILFPFQRDITLWALRKGRAAIFADTGLGKTFMQLEWARLITDRPVLIIAPLSIARQTIKEGLKLGLDVVYSRGSKSARLTITNYEMFDRFDFRAFGAVVLDESSILKGLDGKTRKALTERCRDIRYKLCCTATPAPNDITEIANHAEFLGIMSRADMLATFFVHDAGGWRLKRHGEVPFYRWLASWGMSIRKPSDLGYDDDGYVLPPLEIKPLFVHTDAKPDGALFWTGLSGITERSAVRQKTMVERTEAAAKLANRGGEQWILWCGLNRS